MGDDSDMNSIEVENAIRAIESLANSQSMRSNLPAHQQAINAQIAVLRAALRLAESEKVETNSQRVRRIVRERGVA